MLAEPRREAFSTYFISMYFLLSHRLLMKNSEEYWAQDGALCKPLDLFSHTCNLFLKTIREGDLQSREVFSMTPLSLCSCDRLLQLKLITTFSVCYGQRRNRLFLALLSSPFALHRDISSVLFSKLGSLSSSSFHVSCFWDT